ncbi:MAG: hypothetical protein WBA12_15490 [Catalinimonas sp.]
MKKYTWLLAGALLFAACEPEIDFEAPSAGAQLDLSRYVAYGNSLTAGFADGGLYNAGIEASFPNLLAQQFEEVGGGETFEQPLFNAGEENGSGYLSLTGFTATGAPQLTPVASGLAAIGLGADSSTVRLRRYTAQGPTVQNLGVPGIKVRDVATNGYGFNNPQGFNPFFERLLPDALPGAGASYVQVAAGSQATFFTSWLGNNDVLGYAGAGGDTAVDRLTDVATFRTLYGQMLDVITANGVEGVLGNIPDVASAAYFTTVPFNAVVLDQAQAGALNAAYADFNAGVDQANQQLPSAVQRPKISFQVGPNAIVIEDETLFDVPNLPKFRQATADDLILLPASAALPGGVGTASAAPDNLVLIPSEQEEIRAHTQALNAEIAALATARGLALFDVNAFLTQRVNGAVSDARTYSGAFITGGIFSLDGIHLTPFGNALVANGFIAAINAHYGANVPRVITSEYEGVRLP